MKALLLAVLTCASCFPATIVSTFGPGDSFDNANSYPFVIGSDTVDYAVSFTPAFQYTFTSMRLALAGAAQIQVEIRQGSDPAGTLIESIFDTFGPGILTIASDANPTLLAGVQYWLVARSPGLLFPETGFFYNDQGFTGLSIETAPGVFTPSTGATPAYEVQGDLTAQIPEPGTWVLMGLSLLAIALRRELLPNFALKLTNRKTAGADRTRTQALP